MCAINALHRSSHWQPLLRPCAPASLRFHFLVLGTNCEAQHSWPLPLQVAIEPARPHEMPALVEGLRLLNRADPFVEVSAAAGIKRWLVLGRHLVLAWQHAQRAFGT